MVSQSEQSHRVDEPHPPLRPMGRRGVDDAPDLEVSRSDGMVDLQPHPLEALLPHHLRELIDKLQQWSNDIDRREAEVNARLALLEHRERAGRMRAEAKSKALDQQQRSLQQRDQSLQETLRRLAVGNIQIRP